MDDGTRCNSIQEALWKGELIEVNEYARHAGMLAPLVVMTKAVWQTAIEDTAAGGWRTENLRLEYVFRCIAAKAGRTLGEPIYIAAQTLMHEACLRLLPAIEEPLGTALIVTLRDEPYLNSTLKFLLAEKNIKDRLHMTACRM